MLNFSEKIIAYSNYLITEKTSNYFEVTKIQHILNKSIPKVNSQDKCIEYCKEKQKKCLTLTYSMI
jgi:hypothetical protein